MRSIPKKPTPRHAAQSRRGAEEIAFPTGRRPTASDLGIGCQTGRDPAAFRARNTGHRSLVADRMHGRQGETLTRPAALDWSADLASPPK